jgi:hypothetical protein
MNKILRGTYLSCVIYTGSVVSNPSSANTYMEETPNIDDDYDIGVVGKGKQAKEPKK